MTQSDLILPEPTQVGHRAIDNQRRQTLLTELLQPTHLILILLAALLFLGPKRLAVAGRSLGQRLKEFRTSIAGTEEGLRLSSSAAPAQYDDPSPR